jgi:hypothetical protein
MPFLTAEQFVLPSQGCGDIRIDDKIKIGKTK